MRWQNTDWGIGCCADSPHTARKPWSRGAGAWRLCWKPRSWGAAWSCSFVLSKVRGTAARPSPRCPAQGESGKLYRRQETTTNQPSTRAIRNMNQQEIGDEAPPLYVDILSISSKNTLAPLTHDWKYTYCCRLFKQSVGKLDQRPDTTTNHPSTRVIRNRRWHYFTLHGNAQQIENTRTVQWTHMYNLLLHLNCNPGLNF